MSAFMNHNPNNSFEVAQPPSDSVSSLSFSPKSNLLVSTSWDNQVRCWDIQRIGTNIAAAPKSSFSHDHPVLCSTWKDDGMAVFSGGCDRQVKMWSLMSGGQTSTVAMHDAPIKEIAWIPEMALLVTGSWDKTMKYWDLRQPNPVHTQQLPERCYALTVKHPLMVVGTADRNLIIFNLQSPQTEFKRIISPLKYQTRCVAAFPDKQGFLVGSIEGRVGVQHLDEGQDSKNFTFKCHRENNALYSVNSINFHPVHHTFSTAGSDGSISFWDKDSKQRLKAMQRFAMTGIREQKIIILLLQRPPFSSTCHRTLMLKASQDLVEEGEAGFEQLGSGCNPMTSLYMHDILLVANTVIRDQG